MNIQSPGAVRSVDVTALFAALDASPAGLAMLAHQGGWDEALLIGGPIIVIAGLLVLAKRRVDAADLGAHSPDSADSEASSQTSD